MRQSILFTKTRKEAPKDEVSKNAELLIKAGFIHKEMAGVYDLLPLGLRVIKKIENIIRGEMNLIGGQEIEMTALQGSEIWKQADKWGDDKVDVWFKTNLKNGTEIGLAFSHEEAIAEMLKNHLNSYKDLPIFLYQFQTKFRNELRAKSGIMRGREFLMKDMYSFTTNKEELNNFYEKTKIAYTNIFKRVGLGDSTFITEAGGGVFGDKSHEFQTINEAGEDTIYIDENKKIAINEEVYSDEKIKELDLDKKSLVAKKSIEVGNIFPIETKVSEKIDLRFVDEDGKPALVYMGSYGIGLGRLMGTAVEVLSDENGIVWPEAIAPFDVHLILLNLDDKEVCDVANNLYKRLSDSGLEVLFDDRENVQAGNKFADSDLIGIPKRVIVSSKTLNEGLFELKDRKTGEVTQVKESDILASIKS